MILSKVKTYGLVIAGAAMSVLLIAVRVLTSQNSRLRREAETKDAKLKHNLAVMKSDKEVEVQTDVRLEELEKELEDGKSSELENPNNW